MRTIKFRGKARRDGKWFYGNLYVKDIYGRTHICTPERGCLDIDPGTVGQFTGLCDKNGKEIYEGDILRVNDSTNVVCEFRHGAFGYIYCNEFHPFAGNTNYTFNPKNTDKNFDVIGNIHDNPELLKGGEE